MTNNDRAQFGELLTAALAFYGKDVSAFALDVWWQACQPFELEQVRKALTAHALDPDCGQFAPKPADLVRVLHGTKTDRSLMAWSQVYRAISTVGMYQTPDFGDNAIHAAINDMGGWPKLCQSRVDELPFVQKRFCDLHRAFAGREVEPVQLVGLSEQANMGRALPSFDRPVQIAAKPAALALAAMRKGAAA